MFKFIFLYELSWLPGSEVPTQTTLWWTSTCHSGTPRLSSSPAYIKTLRYIASLHPPLTKTGSHCIYTQVNSERTVRWSTHWPWALGSQLSGGIWGVRSGASLKGTGSAKDVDGTAMFSDVQPLTPSTFLLQVGIQNGHPSGKQTQDSNQQTMAVHKEEGNRYW